MPAKRWFVPSGFYQNLDPVRVTGVSQGLSRVELDFKISMTQCALEGWNSLFANRFELQRRFARQRGLAHFSVQLLHTVDAIFDRLGLSQIFDDRKITTDVETVVVGHQKINLLVRFGFRNSLAALRAKSSKA